MVFPEIDFPLLFPLSRCEIGREEWHIFFVGTRIDDLGPVAKNVTNRNVA